MVLMGAALNRLTLLMKQLSSGFIGLPWSPGNLPYRIEDSAP
jgi:hypothetical protein